MARKARIEFDGVFYHVITRGDQRQGIFTDKEDYRRYLKILADYKVRFDYKVANAVIHKKVGHANGIALGAAYYASSLLYPYSPFQF
jgi:hypothetical protein